MSDLVVYAVEYIEVEFGQRDEGYNFYLFKDECIEDTKKNSASGAYPGGYIGPVKPLCYIEVPFDFIEAKFQHKLRLEMKCRTDDHWQPNYKSKVNYI